MNAFPLANNHDYIRIRDKYRDVDDVMYIIDLLQHSELKIAELKSELYCLTEIRNKHRRKQELILHKLAHEREANKKKNKKSVRDAKRNKRASSRKPI